MLRDNNPYVLLGIPFGASRELANVAFARKARPLKRQGEAGREGLVGLTSALNQIDEVLTEPDQVIDIYRVPADPEAFEGHGGGVFSPAPELLGRRQPVSEQAIVMLMSRAAGEVLSEALRSAARCAGPIPY